MHEGLTPGDRIVDLAGAARTAAILAGAKSATIASWLARRTYWISALSLIAGMLIGFISSTVTSHFIFPVTGGQILVAKVGPDSLPLTFKGNLFASLITATVVCELAARVLKVETKTIAMPAVSAAAVTGVACALLSSLL